MRKLLTIFLITLCYAVQGQDVNKAVDDRVKPLVLPIVQSEVAARIGEIVFDTVVIKSISRAGNIDTLTAPGIYQLSVTGSASAVRIVYVSRSANGSYSIRTGNPLAWSGAGTWATSIINNRVIVSTTNTSLTYQREKIQ